jgi:hypothetical protein
MHRPRLPEPQISEVPAAQTTLRELVEEEEGEEQAPAVLVF